MSPKKDPTSQIPDFVHGLKSKYADRKLQQLSPPRTDDAKEQAPMVEGKKIEQQKPQYQLSPDKENVLLEFLEETKPFRQPTPRLPSTILDSAVIATFDPKMGEPPTSLVY